MSERERPLPQPKTSAFGRRKRYEGEEQRLMADDIARAAAEGKLEELFGDTIPDNEQARVLVSMMMGMSGIPSLVPSAEKPEEPASGEPAGSFPQPPEEVLKAVQEGNVSGLVGLLRDAYKKRSPGEEGPAEPESEGSQKKYSYPQATIGKEVIDGLIGIASDNGVSLDWLILRALKMYVRGYRETGRL